MWDKRSFERLISFTDAVTAVAVTLLILSVIDIRPKPGEQTVWQVIGDNSGQLVTFLFTFIVVAVMWQGNLRVLHRLVTFDATIFWLDVFWMIGIVLLPWTSSMYGDGIGASGDDSVGAIGLGGTGLLYWMNLAVISLLAALMGLHAQRHPDLLDPGMKPAARPRRGIIFAIAFIIVGIATVVSPVFGPWLALLFIPLGFVLSHLDDRWARGDE